MSTILTVPAASMPMALSWLLLMVTEAAERAFPSSEGVRRSTSAFRVVVVICASMTPAHCPMVALTSCPERIPTASKTLLRESAERMLVMLVEVFEVILP